MNWEAHWPFASRASVIAHEDAYCAGFYKPERARAVKLVDAQDLRLEEWLERGGAERLRRNTSDLEAIRTIYLWKARANIETDELIANVPEDLSSAEFAGALQGVLSSDSDAELAVAVDRLQCFTGVRVRVASAFAYWLRPHDFQVIDRRSTEALNLAFADADYTSANYIRFCHLSRGLATHHELTLRQLDRALFTYHKLLSAGHFLE